MGISKLRVLAKFRSFVPCLIAFVLCGCAATSVEKTWNAPEKHPPPTKIAVLAIADRGGLRQGFENRLATQLRKAGNPSLVTYDQLSLPDIKQDKAGAAERFRTAGADSVLILRMVDSTTSYRETQPGGSRYTGMVTGIDNYGWYDYYSVGFMDLSPTYGSLTEKLYLEAALYDLNTEKRIWSGVTKTVLKEQMDRVGEMDPLVDKIIAAMQKDGAIR